MPVENPPAFPRVEQHENDVGYRWTEAEAGMTLRDWFAGQALMGWLASWPNGTADFENYAMLTRGAFDVADAMLAERNCK